MSISRIVNDAILHLAAGFSQAMASSIRSHTSATATNDAAWDLGSELAETMASEWFGEPSPIDASASGTSDVWDDGEIIRHRYSVWNHSTATTSEVVHAIKPFQRCYLPNSSKELS